MENFLDQVCLAGFNTGMYAARQEDTGQLDCNPFNAHWLADTAENATTGEVDEDGDGYMLNALVEAIFRNAGIPLPEETE
jgi:hypothetical protein